MNYIDEFVNGKCGLLIQQSNLFDVFDLEDKIKCKLESVAGKTLSEYWDFQWHKKKYNFIYVIQGNNSRSYRTLDAAHSGIDKLLTAAEIVNAYIDESDLVSILKGD